MYKAPLHLSPIENKRILITGGAGFIGSNIAEYLMLHGAKVRVLDNLATGNMSNLDAFQNHILCNLRCFVASHNQQTFCI